MKKKLLGLVSLVMSVLVLCGAVSGCRLVTTDSQRDMNQVIATVNINEKDEIIYKKDLVMQYLNYGYMYVESYGYSLEQTYNLLFENLVNTTILSQGAMKKFEEEGKIVNADKAKNDPERYLTAKEILNAKYSTHQGVNSLLDSAMEQEEAKYQDTTIGEVRTAPTNAANATVEYTDAEKQAYVDKGFDISSNEKVRAAFNTAIKVLENNELLGKNYNGTLESTDYYKNSYKANLENEVLTLLQNRLSEQARSGLTFASIEAEYNEALEEQKEWSNAKFTESLTNASVSSPMLYSAFGTYGYVHNILLGVTDEQSAKISSIRTDNLNISNADYATKRKEILNSTLVTDLRSSWVNANYDAEVRGTELIFTGDYTFAKDKVNSLAFQGEYKEIKPANAEEKTPAKYTAVSAKTFGLNDFVAFMDGYVGGATTDNMSAYASLGDSVYRAKKLSGVTEYKEKINELLFAFSTDSGSLNTYDGYVIKPAVDGANTEEYVKTFGDAGRILLEQGEGYVIVASDYGYHVMFFSESFTVDFSAGTLVEYLNKVNGSSLDANGWATELQTLIADWEKFAERNDYLYYVASTLTDAKVNNALNEIQREMVNTNRYEESEKVTIYKDRFSDLWA